MPHEIERGAERTADMPQRIGAGATLEAIGAEQVRAYRRAARAAADKAASTLIRTWAINNPGRSRVTAAEELGISVTRITRLLGEEARRLFVHDRNHDLVVSDEEVLVRQAAEVLGTLWWRTGTTPILPASGS